MPLQPSFPPFLRFGSSAWLSQVHFKLHRSRLPWDHRITSEWPNKNRFCAHTHLPLISATTQSSFILTSFILMSFRLINFILTGSFPQTKIKTNFNHFEPPKFQFEKADADTCLSLPVFSGLQEGSGQHHSSSSRIWNLLQNLLREKIRPQRCWLWTRGRMPQHWHRRPPGLEPAAVS